MKCFFHDGIDAVATCQRCGKSLCKACAAKYNPCLCDECYGMVQTDIIDQKKQKKMDALIDTNAEFIAAILKGLACSVGLTLFFNLINTTPTSLDISILFFFVPFGWAVITYIEMWLPSFLMSGIVCMFYLMIKLVFSILLGIPCFLYQIARYIFKLVRARQNV